MYQYRALQCASMHNTVKAFQKSADKKTLLYRWALGTGNDVSISGELCLGGIRKDMTRK